MCFPCPVCDWRCRMRACEASLGADVAPTSPGSGVPRGAGRPADLRPFLAGTGASSLHSAPIVMAFKHLQMQISNRKSGQAKQLRSTPLYRYPRQGTVHKPLISHSFFESATLSIAALFINSLSAQVAVCLAGGVTLRLTWLMWSCR